MVFELIMVEHIKKKKEYLEDVLIINHIKERPQQIKAKIRSVFVEITQEEIAKLDQFVTVDGFNISEPLRSVDLEKFLDEVYMIVFSDDTVEKKLEDFEALC